MSSDGNTPENLKALNDFLKCMIKRSDELLETYNEEHGKFPETDDDIEIPSWFPETKYYEPLLKYSKMH